MSYSLGFKYFHFAAALCMDFVFCWRWKVNRFQLFFLFRFSKPSRKIFIIFLTSYFNTMNVFNFKLSRNRELNYEVNKKEFFFDIFKRMIWERIILVLLYFDCLHAYLFLLIFFWSYRLHFYDISTHECIHEASRIKFIVTISFFLSGNF